MPSRKGTEQAIMWLRNKMAERDSLDAINAEVCYNVILDLQKRRRVIGALYHQAHERNRRMMEERENEYNIFKDSMQVVDIELPEGWEQEAD